MITTINILWMLSRQVFHNILRSPSFKHIPRKVNLVVDAFVKDGLGQEQGMIFYIDVLIFVVNLLKKDLAPSSVCC